MSTDLWGYGWRVAAKSHRAPFDVSSDPHYFPDWTYDSELADGPADDPTHRDLQNSWYSAGLVERKPHIQRGVKHGLAHPDAPLTDTERHLQDMGHEFTRRIHHSEPTADELYRGMTVPNAWVAEAQRSGRVSLPLSSFDTSPDTGAYYAVGDGPAPVGHQQVMLRLAPGAKSYPILSTEHITHGDFAVHGVQQMSAHDFSDLIGEPYASRMLDGGVRLPTVVDIHQRHVPPPAHHTASRSRLAMPTFYHLTDDPDFKLNPNFVPDSPSGEAGVFVTPHSQLNKFRIDYGWDRPYTVPINVPDDLDDAEWDYDSEDPDEDDEPYQVFVPAEHFDKLDVGKAYPTENYDPRNSRWSENSLWPPKKNRKANTMTAAITVYTKPEVGQ